jgi:hypothetical protein
MGQPGWVIRTTIIANPEVVERHNDPDYVEGTDISTSFGKDGVFRRFMSL